MLVRLLSSDTSIGESTPHPRGHLLSLRAPNRTIADRIAATLTNRYAATTAREQRVSGHSERALLARLLLLVRPIGRSQRLNTGMVSGQRLAAHLRLKVLSIPTNVFVDFVSLRGELCQHDCTLVQSHLRFGNNGRLLAFALQTNVLHILNFGLRFHLGWRQGWLHILNLHVNLR